MTKVEVVQSVADKLFAAEHAVDAAILSNTQLLEGIVEGRRELNVAYSSVELAQARVVEAITALQEARRAVVAAHAGLKATHDKVAADVTIAGIRDKDDDAPSKTTGVSLRVAS